MEPQRLRQAAPDLKQVLLSVKRVLFPVKRVLPVAGLLLLAGCNQTALPPTEPDLGIGNFCSGSARVEMNGMTAESPAVSGRLEFLDCCDAAEFQVVSAQISQPLFFAWRHQVGTQPTLPTTLDLLNLPKGWGATLYSGCSPTAPGCTPTDLLTSGFSGTLTVSGTPSGVEMSVCLDADVNAHPVLRSVRLWSPTIAAQ